MKLPTASCGVSSVIATQPIRLRSDELRRGSFRHSSLQQVAGYSGEAE